MPAFFFMSRPKSAGRKVTPTSTAHGSAPQAQRATSSEHEMAARRASPATVMHCLANSSRPVGERPQSASAVRYSSNPPPPQSTGITASPGESKPTTTTTPHDADLFLRYKRPKSAAPVRPNANVVPSGTFTVRPKSAHHNNHPHNPSSTFQHHPHHHHPQHYPTHHHHPHHQPQVYPHQQHHHHPQHHGPVAPTMAGSPYRDHPHVRPDPPPPPGGVTVRRIAFPGGVTTVSSNSNSGSTGTANPPGHPVVVMSRRRDDYANPSSKGTVPQGGSSSSSSSSRLQHHHHMAWGDAVGTTGGSGVGLRIVGQQGMPGPSPSSSSSPAAAKHEASGNAGSSSSSSRPGRGAGDGASHVRNYDLMIPLNKENTTQSGSQTRGDSDAGSYGFPSQTTAELESRHILRQLRTRVSMLETGGGVPQALTPASEAYCSPRQRLYLQQIMLCKMLSWKSTTDFYTFGQLLGQGSFAKVRVALHKLTGQQVAIKTYEKAKLKDSKHWRRVQQEIRLMEKLNNSRVIRLFETIESPKRIHIVMEYLSGSNLCNYVKAKRKLDEDEARVIFSQILESLEYIHSLNMVHRDIKLENVLFDESHRAKLVDFGFSVICKDKRLHVFCGTPSYMAPEIVKRKDYMGKPVDLWSAGVVLYALLCGRFPFSAKTYPDLYKKIARGVFTIPDELSLAAKDLIRNLLVVDPEKRYNLAQTRAHPWLAGVPKGSSAASEANAPRFLISNNPQEDLDRDVIARMEKFGVARDLLVSCILHKQRNSIATTYYLLRHAMAKQQTTSTSTSSSAAVNGNNNFGVMKPRREVEEDGAGGRPVGVNNNYVLHINNKAAGTTKPLPGTTAATTTAGSTDGSRRVMMMMR